MLIVDNKVYQSYPDSKIGALAIKNINAYSPLNETEIFKVLDAIRCKYGHLDRAGIKKLYPIQAYTNYYNKFGYSFHVLAQLESAIKGRKQLHAESSLLQAMFLSELKSMLLTAGHDLSTLRLPLAVKDRRRE